MIDAVRELAVPASFARRVQDALAHLYDPVYLETHPLVDHARLRAPTRSVPAGKQLARWLQEAIERLRPAENGPRDGRAARGVELLRLRYVEALEPRAVQTQLGLGKSQYYLEHARALDAIVALLWDEWDAAARAPTGRETRPVLSVIPGEREAPRRVAHRPVGLVDVELPAPLTTFIGREPESDAVVGLVTGCRLVTLAGPGGVGKTRLALHVAERLRGRFPDGTLYVPLAAVTDPDLVPSAILHMLPLREADDEAAHATLTRFLRDRQFLLILDNFEHLLDAAPRIADLVARCPRLSILVTSRSTLRVSGERVVVVPPLRLPHAHDPGEAADACEAVRLFEDRARAALPGFVLTAQNASVVAGICRRCDGLPLAIELAAARLGVLSVEALLARLERGPSVLAGGPRDLPARQQTLRATMAWSYGLLSPVEQRLLRHLAVFVGGFTLEAAESICPSEQTVVLDVLASLLDKSLLERQSGWEGRVRFAMLETVREYAMEQLRVHDEADAALGRHAAFCVALAEELEPRLYGSNQADWFRRVDDDYPNLRAALRRLIERGDHEAVELGLRLCGALWWYWHCRGYHGEPHRWVSTLLASPNAPPGGRTRGKALLCASLAAWKFGDHDRARACAEGIVADALQSGDELLEATGLVLLGEPEMSLGRHAEARAALGKALVLCRQLGVAWGQAWALTWLAMVALSLGEADAARVQLDESMALRLGIGDDKGLAYSLYGLAALARLQGDHAAAYVLYAEGLSHVRELADWPTIALMLEGLGAAALGQGDGAGARAHFAECLTVYRSMGSRRGIGLVLRGLAAVAAVEGQPDRALRLAGASHALAQDTGIAMVLVHHADLDQWLAPVRAGLGPCADDLWSEGAAMAPEEAADYALGIGGHPGRCVLGSGVVAPSSSGS